MDKAALSVAVTSGRAGRGPQGVDSALAVERINDREQKQLGLSELSAVTSVAYRGSERLRWERAVENIRSNGTTEHVQLVLIEPIL